MKNLALVLICLLISLSCFPKEGDPICNEWNNINANLANAFAYGQSTNDWDCWRDAVNDLLAFQVKQGVNPTTTMLGVSFNANQDPQTRNICAKRCKVLAINFWDMDTKVGISVNHGLGDNNKWKDIRSIDIIIHNDQDDLYYTQKKDEIWVEEMDNEVIALQRKGGGFFDNLDYKNDEFVRGYITLWF